MGTFLGLIGLALFVVGVMNLAWVAAVAIYSAVATALIALAVSLFLPMRVSEDDERQGLDIANHGERGWEFD